ncbi:hypothetical protein GCM10023339_06550 [Alloalcanivorax gelatiniphagus]
MSETPDVEFVTGAPAARRVAEDPFWSTVVRRHGDVDVVVLPQEDVPVVEVPADEPVADAEAARERLRADMASFWGALGLEGDPGRLDDTWYAGAAEGTLRWEGTATFDDVDPVVASGALDRSREVLAAAPGWNVLAPPGGLPRVLAGRPGRFVREEVQVVLASSSRVVLRMRSDLVVVGTSAAAEVLRGAVR